MYKRACICAVEERLEAFQHGIPVFHFKNYDPKVMPFYGRRVEIMNKWYRWNRNNMIVKLLLSDVH